MAKKKIETYEVKLNDKTKITYKKDINDNSSNKKFIIDNTHNKESIQIIIAFNKTPLDYVISVYVNELNKNKINKNKLCIINEKNDNSYPAYKYLNLRFSDGSEKEIEEYIDLNKKEILDEIFFILYHGGYIKEKDILRSFEIITPLLNDLIEEFINYKKEIITYNTKKLAK